MLQNFQENLREQNKSGEKIVLKFFSSLKTVKSKDLKINNNYSNNTEKLEKLNFSRCTLFFETEHNIQSDSIQKLFYDYCEIELNSLQIYRIQKILALKKSLEKK